MANYKITNKGIYMEELLLSINKKLTVIISLLIENQSLIKEQRPEIEIINSLKELGLDNAEIGAILKKDANKISDQLYNYKRRNKKSEGKSAKIAD
ncbi:MAG: hypothetical protein Q8L04_03190 [Ignavibacteria bacterium]|nr:hypothetical protein [Ignavibacteria bacterium]